VLKSVGAGNALYSLGVAHPGAVTLHNSPRFMHSFDRTDKLTIDLIAVDLLRSRERGVPRYNEFRRLPSTTSAAATRPRLGSSTRSTVVTSNRSTLRSACSASRFRGASGSAT